MTPEQRLHELAERIRERARQMPAGAAIEPHPCPTPSATTDRPAATKPGPTAPVPKHWSEVECDEDDHAQTAAPQEAGHMVPEIEIRGFIHSDALPPGAVLETHGGQRRRDEVCSATAVVAQVEAARAAGALALLVVVDSVGGGMVASTAIYRALRAFSDAGGTVIVHVDGMAASSASTIALAGDLVFMAPAARFLVHSGVSFRAGDASGRAVSEANVAMLAVYLERTATPPHLLQEWLANQYDPGADRYNCAELRADAAVQLLWADGVADPEAVRALAGRVAAGASAETPRRQALRLRGAGAEAAIVTDKLAANAVTATKIDALAVTSDKIAAKAITAVKLDTDALQTTNYTPGGTVGTDTEYAQSGAKLRRNDGLAQNAPALLVDPAGFKIGQTVIKDAWFGKVRPMLIREFGHRTATGWQGMQGAGTNATEYLAAGAWDATNRRIRLLGKNMVARGFNEMRLSGAVLNGTYPVPNPYCYEIVAFYNGVAGADLYIDLELWETLYDGSITSMVRRKVDWNTSDGPLFDVSVIFYNSAGTWVGYW